MSEIEKPKKGARKPKVKPSKQELLVETERLITEVKQEIEDLISDQLKIAPMTSSFVILPELIENALEDSRTELASLEDDETELKKPE